MNFEDCKKVMNEWIDGTMPANNAINWFWNRCFDCKETRCHCHECPLFYEGECKFEDLKWISTRKQNSN